jgi:hypothetical protein
MGYLRPFLRFCSGMLVVVVCVALSPRVCAGQVNSVATFRDTRQTTNLAFVRTDYTTADFPDALASADFNRDGRADLITANYSANSISVYLQNSDGSLTRTDYPWPTSGTTLVTGDFNGDGNPDYAAANGSLIGVVLGNGDGTFQPRADYPDIGGFLSPLTGDFNNDGKVDLAALGVVLLGNGDGSFAVPITYNDHLGGSVAAGDLNHDGKLDLVVPHYAYYVPSTVNVLLGNGDGTFQAALQTKIGREGGGAFLGDFNNDGNLDVMIGHGGLTVWGASLLLGNGDGTLQAPTVFDFPAGEEVAAVSDINQDGNLDLLITNPGSSMLTIRLGNGDGTFQPPVNFPAPFNAYEVVVADFNHDGAPDIATSAGSDDVLSIFLNQAGTTVRAGSRPNPSKAGQTVTFQMQVTPTFSELSTPTGTMTLKDGTQTLATVSLQSGRAIWKTSKLSAGSHTITAQYSGDTNYNPNTAAPVAQVVNP